MDKWPTIRHPLDIIIMIKYAKVDSLQSSAEACIFMSASTIVGVEIVQVKNNFKLARNVKPIIIYKTYFVSNITLGNDIGIFCSFFQENNWMETKIIPVTNVNENDFGK